MKPKKEVLDRIAERHYNGVDAAASSADRAVTFYVMIRDLPSTSTRVVLQNRLNLHINGPLSLATPDLLTAINEEDDLFVLKILRPNDRIPYDLHRLEMEQEKETCRLLGLESPTVALCPVEVISITYEDRVYDALQMPRFVTTLQDLPRAFHKSLVLHGRSLVNAVQYMHDKGVVHMDIKADNIFIGSDKTWVLGDFGSSKSIGAKITTSNLVHYVRYPLTTAETIYDWFMLLLVFLKESLQEKNTWISVLCDADEKYDADRIDQYIRGLSASSQLQRLLQELQGRAGSCASVQSTSNTVA